MSRRIRRFAPSRASPFRRNSRGPLAMVEPRYEDVTQREVARVFGPDFAAALKSCRRATGSAGDFRLRRAPRPGRKDRPRRGGRSKQFGRWPSANGVTRNARR